MGGTTQNETQIGNGADRASREGAMPEPLVIPFLSLSPRPFQAGDLAVNVLPSGGRYPVRLLRRWTAAHDGRPLGWIVRVVGGRGSYACPEENLRPAV